MVRSTSDLYIFRNLAVQCMRIDFYRAKTMFKRITDYRECQTVRDFLGYIYTSRNLTKEELLERLQWQRNGLYSRLKSGMKETDVEHIRRKLDLTEEELLRFILCTSENK